MVKKHTFPYYNQSAFVFQHIEKCCLHTWQKKNKNVIYILLSA